jgi:hypothetical protein
MAEVMAMGGKVLKPFTDRFVLHSLSINLWKKLQVRMAKY